VSIGSIGKMGQPKGYACDFRRSGHTSGLRGVSGGGGESVGELHVEKIGNY